MSWLSAKACRPPKPAAGARVAAIRRLLLLLAVTGAALAAMPAAAQYGDRQLSSSVMLYRDSDHVTVLSPRVAAGQELGRWSVDAAVGVDFVTAASVDLVSAASPKGFSEQRWQVDARTGYNFGGGTKARGWYGLSREPDFLSHQVGAGAETEILNRHATLGLGLSADFSTVGRAGDPLMAEKRGTQLLQASWMHVLGPLLLLDLAYTLSQSAGYLANPYRFVRLYDAADLQSHKTSVHEAVPDERRRQAVVVGLRGQLHPSWFLLGQLRAYADDWGMESAAGTVRSTWVLSPQWTADAELRLHGQSRATFYRRQYVTFPDAPAWRTADKELGPMTTKLAGVHLQWRPRIGGKQPLTAGFGVDYLVFEYLDFQFSTGRSAWVTLGHLTWQP